LHVKRVPLRDPFTVVDVCTLVVRPLFAPALLPCNEHQHIRRAVQLRDDGGVGQGGERRAVRPDTSGRQRQEQSAYAAEHGRCCGGGVCNSSGDGCGAHLNAQREFSCNDDAAAVQVKGGRGRSVRSAAVGAHDVDRHHRG
jgi:hypothetical protein